MNKTKVKGIKIKQEDSESTLEYWITDSECDFKNIVCRGRFGVEISEKNENSDKVHVAAINNIFSLEDEAKIFAYRMAEEQVSSYHLLDVVADILIEQKKEYFTKYCSINEVT